MLNGAKHGPQVRVAAPDIRSTCATRPTKGSANGTAVLRCVNTSRSCYSLRCSLLR